MKLYHSAYKHNRASIERRGLLARDPCEHNYGPCIDEDDWANGGVLAVYAATRPGYWIRSGGDVWEIDAEGLPLELDPVLNPEGREKFAGDGVSYRILSDVPPERISRYIAPIETATFAEYAADEEIPF